MARNDAVWGIDIGQCAIKALHCRQGAEPGELVADAFDYYEYPKMLNQPDADPAELIKEALEQFLSRNSVRGSKVAISVPGQAGLARFIKLPPVESKKIPDIVKYEARQQIPFALDDVVWDYQQLSGGAIEEGFALETEVGLFAMRRDQVARSLEPFKTAGIEVDMVQLTPLALCNFVLFDQLKEIPSPEDYDPDNPPPYIIVLSIGTETTDIVAANGYRVWQRSFQLGGNHFTKALTKELKLTAAKAEHLKRNAASADDPKRLFQAMRPVFGDLLSEVQRSLSYFQNNVDRNAKIDRIVAVGNAMKLPGLQRYLTQNLGMNVIRLDAFQTLSGPGVVDNAQFRENAPALATTFGLCVQMFGGGIIRTNLLPREIIKDRIIREKQPWAVGAAAALILGMTVSSLGYWRAWASAREDDFSQQMTAAQSAASSSNNAQNAFQSEVQAFDQTLAIGQRLLDAGQNRNQWARVLQAINEALPSDPGEAPENLNQRNQIFISTVEAQEVTDLASWFSGVRQWYRPVEVEQPATETPEEEDETAAESTADVPMQPPLPGADGAATAGQQGPTGPGWVIQLTGYHFHNDNTSIATSGNNFLEQTVLQNLNRAAAEAKLNADSTRPDIGFAVLVNPGAIDWNYRFGGSRGGSSTSVEVHPRFDFVIQIAWKPEGAAAPAAGGIPQ